MTPILCLANGNPCGPQPKLPAYYADSGSAFRAEPSALTGDATKAQADSYLRKGIPSGTHFTTKAAPGPPLIAGRATAPLRLAN